MNDTSKKYKVIIKKKGQRTECQQLLNMKISDTEIVSREKERS